MHGRLGSKVKVIEYLDLTCITQLLQICHFQMEALK